MLLGALWALKTIVLQMGHMGDKVGAVSGHQRAVSDQPTVSAKNDKMPEFFSFLNFKA